MGETVPRTLNIPEEWRTSLSKLIEKYFAALVDEKSPTVKIPELIKMIELHAKGEPQSPAAGEFWAHIEGVRRRKQAESEAASATPDQPVEQDEEAGHESTVPDSHIAARR